MIAFYLETDSGVPAYLQLVQQVEQAIRLGRLTAGDRLPSVREVVGALGINPNTVVKAYGELENRHLVDTRQGSGTFVADTQFATPLAIPSTLQRKLHRWILEARAAGLGRRDLAAIFEEAIRQMFAEGAA
jgi:GntR family transcriptional regulator